MIPLVVATRNPGKLREFRLALRPLGFEVLDLGAVPGAPEVDETGDTFEDNAALKAVTVSRHTPHPVLADDSGLEVDALGGAPGVRSARYGGPGLDDTGRVRALLQALQDVPPDRRGARFRCVLALARGGRLLGTWEGRVEGTILDAPRGRCGFGYDPVFFYPPSGRAFAELSPGEKQAVSHRGAAIRAFVEALRAGAVPDLHVPAPRPPA